VLLVGIELAHSCPRTLAARRSSPFQGPTNGFRMDIEPFCNVLKIDTLLNLCFDSHPVLLPEHKAPPVELSFS
jgi:hypothetical protein